MKIKHKKKGNLTSFGLSVVCLALLLKDVGMAEKKMEEIGFKIQGFYSSGDHEVALEMV